jgi:hypothetical protein
VQQISERAAGWLLAGPAMAAERSLGTICSVSTPLRAAGTQHVDLGGQGLVRVAPSSALSA